MNVGETTAVHVVAAVIENEGRFLLALRPPGKFLAGHWEFPGGKVEKHEDPETALARELKEELSATAVEVEQRIGQQDHNYGEIRVLIDAYCVRCDFTSLRPNEHASIGWFTPDQMRALPLAQADLFLIPLLTVGGTVP